MARATVIEFSQQGFGKLQLESGEVYNFDVIVCNTMEIEPGDTAEVTLKQVGKRTLVRQVMFDKVE